MAEAISSGPGGHGGGRDYSTLALLAIALALLISYGVSGTAVVIPQSEDVAEWWPYRRMVAEAWRQGLFPLWSPALLCGLPLAGWPHASGLDPLGAVFSLMDYSAAMTVTLCLHLFIFGAGLAFLLRSLGQRPETALVAAAAVTLIPVWLAFQFEILPTVLTVAWSPLLFGCAIRLIASGRPRHLAGIAAAFALQILGGRYDFIIRELLVMGLAAALLLAAGRLRPATLGLWLAGGLLGALLAAPALLMHAEYFSQSLRSLPLSYDYYHATQRDAQFLFLGMVGLLSPTVVLALLGLRRRRPRAVAAGALPLLGLCLLWTLAPDWFVRLNHLVPILDHLRFPHAATYLAFIILAVLIGEGIEGWLAEDRPEKFIGPLLLGMAVFAGLYLAVAMQNFRIQPPLSEIGTVIRWHLTGKAASGVVLALLAAGLAYRALKLRRVGRGRAAFSRLLRLWLLLMIADPVVTALAGGPRLQPWRPPVNPLTSLRRRPELIPYRVHQFIRWADWRQSSISIQSGSEPGSRSFDGYISLPVLRYGEALGLVSSGALSLSNRQVAAEDFMHHFKESDFLSPRSLAWLDFLNVRYFLAHRNNIKFGALFFFRFVAERDLRMRGAWTEAGRELDWEQEGAAGWAMVAGSWRWARLQGEVFPGSGGPWMVTAVTRSAGVAPRLRFARGWRGSTAPAARPIDLAVAEAGAGPWGLEVAAVPLARGRGFFRWREPRLFLPDQPLKFLFRDQDTVVYENPEALPLAFFAHAVQVIPDHDERLAYLRDHPSRLRTEAVLERAPARLSEGSPAAGEGVLIQSYQTQSLALQVGLQTPGLLVMSEVWYPGWRAQVDGAQVSILRANHAFRALALPAGTHSVKLTYAPPSFRLGLGCGLATLVGAAIFGLAAGRSQKRKGPCPRPEGNNANRPPSEGKE